jgi:hypothetical protein
MVDKNDDYLIEIYEKDIGSTKELIEKTLELMKKERANTKNEQKIPHFYHKSSLKEKSKA